MSASRESRVCPRTWPHGPHGPWRTGELVHPADIGAITFDCPGRPAASPTTEETTDE